MGAELERAGGVGGVADPGIHDYRHRGGLGDQPEVVQVADLEQDRDEFATLTR